MQLLTYLLWPQVPINCSHRINSKSNVIESVTLKIVISSHVYFEKIPFIVYILQYGRSTLQLDSYKWFLRKRWRLWKIEYNNFRWRQNLKWVSFTLLFCSVRQENVLQSVLRDYFLFFLTNSIALHCIALHCSCRIYLSSLRHSFQQKSRECICIERALYKCISLIVSFRKCTTKALALI